MGIIVQFFWFLQFVIFSSDPIYMKVFSFLFLIVLLVSFSFMLGCNAGDPFQITAPPSLAVVKVEPAENASEVGVDQLIKVTFENDVNEKTLNRATFLLASHTGTNIPGSITYDASIRTATYQPLVPLRPGVRYEINIDQVKGKNGEFIPPHIFYFTTASELLVESFAPRNQSEGVKVSGLGRQDISVRFNRSINSSVLTANNFRAFEQSIGGDTSFPSELEASLEYDDSIKQLTLRPLTGRLKYSSHYYVTLRDILSTDGARLDELRWEFQTESVKVNAITPSQGSSNVATNTPIEIFFQGAVDTESVIGNVRLRKAFGIQEEVFFKGPPTFDLGDTKVTFQTVISEADTPLSTNTRYEIIVRGVKTFQGEFFQEFKSTFTTRN